MYVYISSNTVSKEKLIVRIPKSSNFSRLTEILEEKKLIDYSSLFKVSARLLNYDRQIRSGEYELSRGLNSYALVKELKKAKAKLRKVTLIEGLLYKDIVPILSETLSLDEAKLRALYQDRELLKKFDIKGQSIEGYISPESYFFEWGKTEREIIDFLMSRTYRLLQSHKKKIDSLKMSFNEVLTLASIIEAESNFPDEMPTVSSVYQNRLKRGWKLEADPTIIFILGKAQRVLFKHLKIKSPYNTYLNYGLPPAPINNPGKDAILAAIYPKETKYYFFTGTGDGTGRHLFGKTLGEHNRNRKQLDAARKKRKK